MSIIDFIKSLFKPVGNTPAQSRHQPDQMSRVDSSPAQPPTEQRQHTEVAETAASTGLSEDAISEEAASLSTANTDTARNNVAGAGIENSEPAAAAATAHSTQQTGEQTTTMNHVIIGTGPAGVIAAETIRKLDPQASITLIGDEPEPPYSRMAIPYLLEENIEEPGTYLRKTAHYFDDKSIAMIHDHVASIDPEHKTVNLKNRDDVISWDRLLIATGSHPITPPIPGLDHKKVSTCWTLEDARDIIEGVKPDSVVVQIGAGFIGCIILESLVNRGATLTVVEMGDRMVPRMLDHQCGTLLKDWCVNKGVSVLTSTQVNRLDDLGERVRVNFSNGESIEADYVISATGVRSNIGFLEGSGIETNDGIIVNRYLETNVPGIYAAGDVAEGIDFSTGEYSVQAIQPTATEHGMIAGKNMVTGNTSEHKGSVLMNVLATLGLISVSYGLWEGTKGGESAELADPDNFRYIRLQFDGDKLVGANTLGITQNIGAIRGLIQTKMPLGIWKERLMENPLHFMEAYVGIVGNHTWKKALD